MAQIIGAVTTSHVPAIGGAIAKGLQQDPYWKPFFDGFPPIREYLADNKPDLVVILYNDHGLNFFLDKMPTFAVGAAHEYLSEDEGWGIPPQPAFEGDVDSSWSIINSLIDDEFDITTCQEMLVDHATTLPMALLWPEGSKPGGEWPCPILPVCINTVQYPLPSPTRCYKLGQALNKAIKALPADKKVLIIGSGGLSHQLDGERAGHINKPFDMQCMEKLVNEPEWLTQFTNVDLVDKAGTQGVEVLMWLAARAAMGGRAKVGHSNYHIPISNTAAATMLFVPETEKALEPA